MTPSAAALSAEVRSDPLGLGYGPLLASGSHAGIAALLNAPNYTLVRSLPLLTLLQWSAATGVRAAIENYTDAQRKLPAAQQTPVYAMCLSVQDMFWGAFAAGHVFDLADPAIAGTGGLLDAMVAVGIMSAAQKGQLVGLATGPASRAEVLWGSGVVVGHPQITAALAGV